MNTVLSGQIFGGITPFQWTLSGNCVLDNLSFQLYDHNHQWIEIIQLSGSNLGFSFDSHFLSTGWYATTGLNASGQIYTVTPGLYSGVSSNFWTGYKVKILNSAWEVLYRSSGFTLDNLHPTLTGVSFVSSWVITTGTVHFVFSGSELLSGVTLSLSSGTVISSTTSWLAYDYVLGGFGTGFSGLVNYTLSFSDLAWNVSSYLGTGSLMFSGSSFTGVTLTGLMLTGNTGALPLLEAMKLEFSKFAECKSQLTYKTLPLTVWNKKFTLEMPSFEKSEVRKLVSAFSYYVIKKLDSVHTLDQTELDAITKTYNNFLVVLKLMKDDDNSCKQNLGNYYMGLFKSTMEKYGITQL